MNKKSFTFTLPIELVDKIRNIAQIEKRPLSNQVEYMLEHELKTVEHVANNFIIDNEIKDVMVASLSGLSDDLEDEGEDKAWSYL
ncbi:MAG: hypothetical protein IEMM0008_0344 [bacterium]|nr:MAG: hypothetical protein IEMM0008_0344 [bacterium]